MNNSKKLGIFIIVTGLLIILAIVYFIFMRDSTTTVQTSLVENTPTIQLPVVTNVSSTTPSDRPRHQEYDITEESVHEIDANDVAKLAVAFAERLGSYSNQSDYSNFEDLNIFMTSSMRDWALTYVEKMRIENPYNGSYYGIVTKAVGTEVVNFNDNQGSAEIIVSTQKEETTISGAKNSYQQDLRLTFVKEADQWLIDGAYWLK